MVNKTLQAVDFISSDGKLISGLVPIRDVENLDLSIDEKAAVFYAKTFGHIHYVFFRRFSDGRSSQIAAYIVDNSDEKLSKEALAELHLKVWLHGASPLLYVSWPTRIDILTCARGPDFWDRENEKCQYIPTEKLDVRVLKTVTKITHELNRFSALRLADGTFWEAPYNRALADYDKTAHQLLIQAVVETDRALEGERKPVLRQLLLLMVLVKYLEDRHVFPDAFFGRYHKGAQDFFGVLKGGNPDEVGKLLDFLEGKFNGDVFSLPSAERLALNKGSLIHFANLVEAKTLKQQRYLWKQFSFEHLPVEIISNLYQRFVGGGHGTVYTPPLLASLLLDYAMPYEKITGKERILDPACGSGIFLVSAFKRLINFWRSQNNWQRPNVDTLKRILRQSIFGIELDKSAIHLTAFSMCLAICDALQPDVIWEDLKFDILRERNLLGKDFFSVLCDFKQGNPTVFQEGFDVIIGNPPFESNKLSADGVAINQTAQQRDPDRGSLPDKQSAYLFLEQSLAALRSDGKVCLIQPSGLIYNQNSRGFFNTLHREYKVEAILDFTSIRKLYDEADPKTIAVLACSSKPTNDYLIDHLTFRRTVSVKERICFELDHYDRHRVSRKQAELYPYVWRANLLGGGRLFGISQRLQNLRPLAEYVEQQGWEYGEGFIVASGKKLAPFLTNRSYLPTKAFTDAGINKNEIKTLTVTGFESPRCEERFTPPLILIKEMESLPVDYWDADYLTYNSRIVGIHAPKAQTSELRNLYKFLLSNREIYQFCCALYSTESLVNKSSTIRKQDIDALPYPENTDDLSLSFWERALCEDSLKYMAEYVRLGQNSELLQKAANIDDLRNYSEIFIRMLSSVYDNLQASDPIFRDGLTCQPFYFGEHPDSFWFTEQKGLDLRALIYDEEKHEFLRTVRVLRFYSDNCLLLIKPDRLRYWIRSTAIRDADETIVDLRRQGY